MLYTNLHCPGCDRRIERNSSTVRITTSSPKDGDTAVCLHCGTIFIYGVGVVVIQATPEQIQALGADEQEMLAEESAAVHNLKRRPDDLPAIAQALEDMVRKARAVHVELPAVQRAIEVLRSQIEVDRT